MTRLSIADSLYCLAEELPVVQLQQKVMTSTVVASMMVNIGTVLLVSAMTAAASVSFVLAGVAGLKLLTNWIKVGIVTCSLVFTSSFRAYADSYGSSASIRATVI